MDVLELIFDEVYTENKDTHPSNLTLAFCITDELGKIEKAIPNDKKAPDDLRSIYESWREARVAADAQKEAEAQATKKLEDSFKDVYEAVYATKQVNVRSGPGTNYDKLGSLNWGDGVTRTGIGTGDYSSWSRVEFSNGTVAYVASSYLSTTKPVAQQSTQSSNNGGGNSTTTSQNTSGSSSTQTKPADTSTPSSSSSGTVERTAENNYGFNIQPGYHIEVGRNGGYFLVNDETGYSEKLAGDKMEGYVAGEGQIESNGPGSLPEGYSWAD